MDMKRTLMIGLILIALATTITAIYAESSVIETTENVSLVNNNLTINNINFKIPDGYSEIEKETDTSGTDDNGEKEVKDIDGTAVDKVISEDFKNSAGDKIEIDVGIKGNDQKITAINPANSEQKTINGKEGYLIKGNDDGKAVYKFEYLQDGKIVKISVSNEDLLSQIIS